jgi:hypothetical protein
MAALEAATHQARLRAVEDPFASADADANGKVLFEPMNGI